MNWAGQSKSCQGKEFKWDPRDHRVTEHLARNDRDHRGKAENETQGGEAGRTVGAEAGAKTGREARAKITHPEKRRLHLQRKQTFPLPQSSPPSNLQPPCSQAPKCKLQQSLGWKESKRLLARLQWRGSCKMRVSRCTTL